MGRMEGQKGKDEEGRCYYVKNERGGLKMITENYIKMCEKAEEIQKSNINIGKRHFSNQDFVAYNFGEGLKVYVCNEISWYWTIQDLIWLPTQEQLQEMILSNPNADFQPLWLISKFKFFTDRINIGSMGTGIENSMNELWLAFIMKELYHKIWTDKQWKKAVK